MKTKNLKKLALTCFATAFLACGSIGFVVADFETSAATDSIGSFKMVDGASIRTVAGTTGIRYTAKFDKALYNVVKEDENREFGMIITKLDYYNQAMEISANDLIAGLNELGGDKYVLISESSANPCTPYLYTLPSGETEYRVSGALTNIKYDHADWTWMGVGVVITHNDDAADTYEYATTDETNARTTAYVASAALNDEAYGYKDYEKDVMRDYVYEYAAKVDGVAETAFEAQADKSTYLNGVTAEIGNGIDTSEKYNENVEGKETYLTINENETVNIAVKTATGKVLDLACETATDNDEVVKVENFNTLTPLKNGYAKLTVSSAILGDWTETVTAYVGSESVAKLTETSLSNWTGAKEGYHSKTETGTIKGENYYGYAGSADLTFIQFYAYSDTLSAYYIEHMIAQGYTHVRMPFYFDTSLTHSLFEGVGETNKETSPVIRGQAYAISATETYCDTTVDCDEWIYWDMDIKHYLARFVEADYEVLSTYGVKTTVHDSWWCTNALIDSIQNTLVYFGEQTFVKSNGYTVVGEDTTATFGEIIDLSATYTTTADIALSYEVNGVPQNKMLAAVNGDNTITVNGNVYTETLDGWDLSIAKSEDVTKTLTVTGGVNTVNLVDVNGIATDVSIGAYTGADALTSADFDVTQTYKKRYSDPNESAVVSDTVENTERGIFYVDVAAKKAGETYTYSTTIDVYNSTEPVEYESFGHADSGYAVKAYYYIAAVEQGYVPSYETLTTTYTQDSGMGLAMTVGDGYMSVQKFSSGDTSTTGVQNAYGDLVGSLTGMGYLAIDQSKIKPDKPLTADGLTDNDNTTQLYVYVAPRHTKEYYALYAQNGTTSVLKYACAAGWSAGQGQSKVHGIQSIVDGTVTLGYKDFWSAEWSNHFVSGSTITLQTIVDNYEALTAWELVVYRIQAPHGGWSEVDLNDGTGKLGALLF